MQKTIEVNPKPDPEVPGVTLVDPCGRLDALGATELWDAASPRVTADSPSVLVDMSGVELLSSSGISTLIRLLTRAKSNGGGVAVFGCVPGVRMIFEIVGMEGLLNICPTAEEARQRLR